MNNCLVTARELELMKWLEKRTAGVILLPPTLASPCSHLMNALTAGNLVHRIWRDVEEWRWKLLKFPDEIKLLERRVLNIKMVTRLQLSAWNFVHWCPVLGSQTRSLMKWNQIHLEWNWFYFYLFIYLIYSPPLSLIFLLPPHNNQFSLLNPGVWSNHPIVAFYLTVVVLAVSILFYFHLFQIISFIHFCPSFSHFYAVSVRPKLAA